jgi:hypothetical protein
MEEISVFVSSQSSPELPDGRDMRIRLSRSPRELDVQPPTGSPGTRGLGKGVSASVLRRKLT